MKRREIEFLTLPSRLEQEEYLDQFYHGAREHWVHAKITAISGLKIFAEARSFVTDDGIGAEVNLFTDTKANILMADAKDYDDIRNFQAFCEERHLKVGAKCVCKLVIPENPVKGHAVSFDLRSIGRGFINLMGVYKDQHWDRSKVFAAFRQGSKEVATFLPEDVAERVCRTLADFDIRLSRKNRQLDEIQDQIRAAEAERDRQKAEVDESVRTYHEKELAKASETIETEKVQLQNDLKEKRKELEGLEQACAQKQRILDAFQSEKQPDKEDIIFPQEPQAFPSFEDSLHYVQGFLKHHHGLDYDLDTLRMFALALQTNQLILLVGRSGTGKSSLAQYFPEAFGFEQARIIPVQPSWTDKSDLLGYYNPIDQTYVPTPFLDELMRYCRLAKTHPERLYFLCLDEMNLAHVEYYFAEFLSKLQSERPSVQLYSEEVAADIRQEIEGNPFTDERGDLAPERVRAMSFEEQKYCQSLRRKARMLKRYPATFDIPRNIKFIGTLNQDETTMDLSPKVLDRSLVLRLERCGAPVVPEQDAYDAPALWREPEEFPTAAAVSKIGEKTLENLRTSLKELDGVYFSSRAMNCTFEHAQLPAWCRAFGARVVKDALLAMALLPKVRLEGEAYTAAAPKLRDLCKGAVCKRIYEAIDDGTSLDFWRS